MKHALVIAAALACAGCAQEPEVVTVVAERHATPLPGECLSPDPSWQSLPDADVSRSTAARNYATNKRQYNTVLSRRSVCRAAIIASQKG